MPYDSISKTIQFVIFMGKAPAWAAPRVAKFLEGIPFTNKNQFQDDTEKVMKIDAFVSPLDFI